MKKLVFTALFIYSIVDMVSAQSKRFSADFHFGIPYSLASIKSSTSTFGGVGLRYNLTREISIQGLMEVGSLAGEQPVAKMISPDQPANYLSFNNNFFSYSANVQLNLDRSLNLRKILKRFNPYFIAGTGFMQSNVTSTRVDNFVRHYNQNFYVSFAGFQGRYYLSPELDLTFGSSFYYSQTPFIDGIAIDKLNDSYILNHIGITYKIGAKIDKQHIEWTNIILTRRENRVHKENKPPEKRNRKDIEGEAINDDETLIIFYHNKINGIQGVTRRLVQQSGEQMEQIEKMKSELTSFQQSLSDLKSMIVQLSESGGSQNNNRVMLVSNNINHKARKTLFYALEPILIPPQIKYFIEPLNPAQLKEDEDTHFTRVQIEILRQNQEAIKTQIEELKLLVERLLQKSASKEK